MQEYTLLYKLSQKADFTPKGEINVKPFLDESDGGTLNKKNSEQPTNFIALIIVLIALFLIIQRLLELAYPILNSIFKGTSSAQPVKTTGKKKKGGKEISTRRLPRDPRRKLFNEKRKKKI